MKMRSLQLLLATAFLFVFTTTLLADEEVDSLNVLTKEIPVDTIQEISQIMDSTENERILNMLDSLVALKFFSNHDFTTDTNHLNVFNFEPDYVPVYPDSVIQQRINDLNRESLFELTLNRQVKSYIHTYANKRRELTSKVLGLSEVYFPLFEETLDKYNMPLELKYLAVVESALNPTANSRAGAKGLWQFMYSTGKIYGLKSTTLVDDRFDPIKSTDAACRHLQDLYDIYGNWSLALAAYNSGPGNVNRAIRRAGGVKSYWAIWPYLPRETRGYVPAFFAVMYIMNYPAEHNLYPIHPGILAQEIDTVTIKDVLSFDQISEMMDISYEELKYLNPSFKNGIIPSSEKKQYILRLPHQYIAAFVENEAALYEYKTSKGIEKEKLVAEIKKAQERNIHVVRSGENLGYIAQKYRCSVSSLKSWNNLRSNTIYPGQKLVVYAPGYSGSKSVASSTPTDISNRDKGTHKVKNGENLGLIAKKYNCNVSDLKKWNNLKNNTIHPGQNLLVYEPKKVDPQSEKNISNNTDGNYVYHTVRKGDTLWDIAKLYDGVSVEQIKVLNNIQNSKRLKPGQKIKVAEKS
jgi:membrane-bound lytic murein transglycosylase D